MSNKIISVENLHSVSVVDVSQLEGGELSTRTWDYSIKSFSHDDTVNIYVEGILLMKHKTARTNVIIRNANGRFVSYKDVPELTDAVSSLSSFPTYFN